MNKSFIKGLIAGAGIVIASALAGIFIAGCAMLSKPESGNNTTSNNKIGVGTPTPVAEITKALTEVSGNPGNEAEITPQPGVTTQVAETTQVPETKGNTPTPTPTRVLNYDITGNLLSEDFQDKLLLLGQIIQAYYYKPVGVEDLQDGLYKGIMSAIGDPYTCYYTPEEYTSLMESTSGTYCGIGCYVSQNMKTMLSTIVRPFVDGPAYNAGIKAGDIIAKVDGIDVTQMELTNIVAMMKGPENTQVTVTVYRESVSEYIDIVITRAFIDVPTVEHEMLENNIGYIAVTSFDSVTEEQFISAIDDLTNKGMKSLILDLRDNGGGLLTTCVNMVDYILEDGKMIVYTEDRNKDGDKYYSKDGHSVDVPIVILVNQYSASASEVFTGALKDHKVATVMGTTSFGKGIVQSVIPLNDGSGIKLTTSSYFGPNGVCVQDIGIEPDIVVEYDSESETDNQKQAAIDYLSK